MPLIGAGGDIIRRSDVNEESRYNQQILLLHRTISLLLTKPEGVGCISKEGRERGDGMVGTFVQLKTKISTEKTLTQVATRGKSKGKQSWSLLIYKNDIKCL